METRQSLSLFSHHLFLIQESEDSLLHALDAFNSAVSMNPDHAEAHHQRGLCRVHLQDSTGVQDFNKALQINPNLYQVHIDSSSMHGLSELTMFCAIDSE